MFIHISAVLHLPLALRLSAAIMGLLRRTPKHHLYRACVCSLKVGRPEKSCEQKFTTKMSFDSPTRTKYSEPTPRSSQEMMVDKVTDGIRMRVLISVDGS